MTGPIRWIAFAAFAALGSSGGMTTLVAVAGLLILLFFSAWPARPRLWLGGHVVALVAAGLSAWSLGPVDGFGLLVGWLLVHRIGTGRGHQDERLALLLAVLVLLLATVASLSPLLLPALLVVGGLGPAVLLRAEGVRSPALERRVGLASLAGALMLFLLLPRLQSGLLQGVRDSSTVLGFPADLSIGDRVEQGDDRELVMRVRAEDRAGRPVGGPIYLRGRSLDHFDGVRWSASAAAPRGSTYGEGDLITEILLEPLASDLLFGPPDILRIEGISTGTGRDSAGDWHHRTPGRRVAYRVVSRRRGLDRGLSDLALPAWLELPPLDPRVRAVAAAIAPPGAAPAEVIDGALRHLREGFSYTESPAVATGDPLAWFLTESRSGHCEYYASALAVLLRARGVPARLATGFYSAETSDAGGYVAVRRGHAHAWVEVPVRGGWAVVDASPTGALPAPEVDWWTDSREALGTFWYALVLDYDLDTQLDALEAIGSRFSTPIPGDPIRTRASAGMRGFAVLFVALLGAGTVLRLVLRVLARPAATPLPDEGLRLVHEARRVLRRKGWALPADLPAMDAAAWLRAEAGEAAAPFEALVSAVYAERYGGQPADGRPHLDAVRRMPRRPRDGAP